MHLVIFLPGQYNFRVCEVAHGGRRGRQNTTEAYILTRTKTKNSRPIPVDTNGLDPCFVPQEVRIPRSLEHSPPVPLVPPEAYPLSILWEKECCWAFLPQVIGRKGFYGSCLSAKKLVRSRSRLGWKTHPSCFLIEIFVQIVSQGTQGGI